MSRIILAVLFLVLGIGQFCMESARSTAFKEGVIVPARITAGPYCNSGSRMNNTMEILLIRNNKKYTLITRFDECTSYTLADTINVRYWANGDVVVSAISTYNKMKIRFWVFVIILFGTLTLYYAYKRIKTGHKNLI